MPRISPFEALVYDADVSGPLDTVTTPPYDVISEARKREFLTVPYGIARLDLPGASDPVASVDDGDPYETAGALLRSWQAEGALRRLDAAFHAYEMRVTEGGGRRVRGILCALELEPWGGGVLPHERTLPGPLEDRLRLLRATHTHLSPIYGTVAGPCPELADLLDRAMARPPDAEAMDEQGVRHRRWTVPPDGSIGRWMLDEPLLIADGHHRYTTALAFRDEMRTVSGAGAWDGVLALIVDAGTEHLPVQPFHRVQLHGPVPDLGRPMPSLEAVMDALSDDELLVGIVRSGDPGTGFRLLELRGDPPTVRVLHHELLDGVVPIDALRFTPDPMEALEAVRDERAVAAYLLPPTTTERIRAVIDRGERLPPKSTYFWPKPRTGMVLMPLDPAPVTPRRAAPTS